MFAEKITRNPWVKMYLYNLQNGICPWCGNKLYSYYNGVIHHTEYQHKCSCPENSIKIYDPTINLVNRHSLVPHCGICENSLDCMLLLTLVHPNCNKEINDVQIEQYNIKVNPPVPEVEEEEDNEEELTKEDKKLKEIQEYLDSWNTFAKRQAEFPIVIKKLMNENASVERIEQFIRAYCKKYYYYSRNGWIHRNEELHKELLIYCKEEYWQRVKEFLYEWRSDNEFGNIIKAKCDFIEEDGNNFLFEYFNIMPVFKKGSFDKRYIKIEDLTQEFLNENDCRVLKGMEKYVD